MDGHDEGRGVCAKLFVGSLRRMFKVIVQWQMATKTTANSSRHAGTSRVKKGDPVAPPLRVERNHSSLAVTSCAQYRRSARHSLLTLGHAPVKTRTSRFACLKSSVRCNMVYFNRLRSQIMDSKLRSSCLVLCLVISPFLLLAGVGCQNSGSQAVTDPVGTSPTTKGPGPHNINAVIDFSDSAIEEFKRKTGEEPTLIIYLPANDDAYPKNSAGKYFTYEDKIDDDPSLSIRGPGPHNILVTFERGPSGAKGTGKPLPDTPRVWLHFGTKDSTCCEKNKTDSVPLVIINVPDNYRKGPYHVHPHR